MHTAFAVNHCHVVGAHLARARRVEGGFGVLADELVQLFVCLHVGARADLAATVWSSAGWAMISRVRRMPSRNSCQSCSVDM